MSAEPYAKLVATDTLRTKRPQQVFSREPVYTKRRYFFHVRRGQVTVLDQSGVEFPCLEFAAKETTRRAQGLASKTCAQDGAGDSGMIIVADNEWRTMIEVPF